MEKQYKNKSQFQLKYDSSQFYVFEIEKLNLYIRTYLANNFKKLYEKRMLPNTY